MATITYTSSATTSAATPTGLGFLDLSVNAYNQSLATPNTIVSSSATSIVLENAQGRLVLTALAATPFTFNLDGSPLGGTISSGQLFQFDALTGLPVLVATLNAINTIVYSGMFNQPLGATLLSGVDTITGTALDDFLQGGSGNDILNGLAGNDTLDGGAGIDTMTGGLGNDRYILNDIADVVVEAAGGGVDTVVINTNTYAIGSYTMAANVENLEIAAGTYNTSVVGNALNNTITGSGYGNKLDGGAGNDRITGTSGGDIIIGGLGADTMFGGLGADTYYVDNIGDKVYESIGTSYVYVDPQLNVDMAYTTGDTIVASMNYTLGANVENLVLNALIAQNGTGNASNNIIVANNANNIMNGGLGSDTVSFATATLGVTANLALTTAQVTGGSGTDTLLGFENAVGGAGNDILTGTSADNVLLGGLGNDTLTGGLGNDYLDGGTGIDTMVGGIGNTTYVVDNIADVVGAEALNGGIDLVKSSVSYTLGTNIENLTISAYTANNVGTGNALNNILDGSTTSGVTLKGLAGNDILKGSTYGSNFLDGGQGADTMTGSYSGSDTFMVDNVGDVVIDNPYNYNYVTSIDTVISSISYTLGANIENLKLGDYSSGPLGMGVAGGGTLALNGSGNALDNVIGANTGNNVLNGGLGSDTVSYSYAISAITASLALTTVQATGGSGLDKILNFENIVGSQFNDILTGSATDNKIDGGLGNDTMTGGLGNDSYKVNSALDVVVEAVGGGIDSVESDAATYTLAANVENLTLTGLLGIAGTGNALDNVIKGNAGNNLLSAGDGNDTINGGVGLDSMTGGNGNDTYFVDNVGDTITETALATGGVDNVVLAMGYSAFTPYVLSANVENLQVQDNIPYDYTNPTSYYNYSSVTVTGNASNNIMKGAGGADSLNGMDGNDTLSGGKGNDSLTGGLGNDNFLFDSVIGESYYGYSVPNTDMITDFTAGVDKIQLDDAIFTALTGPGALAAGSLVMGAVALNANTRVLYDAATGALSYDADGTGTTHSAVQFATLGSLTHPLTLASTDFLIV
jgi:Ca2+-binding RTX toxin-like protein